MAAGDGWGSEGWGFEGFSVTTVSVEKAFGSKSKGEGERLKPLCEPGESECGFDRCSVGVEGRSAGVEGDNECSWLIGSSFTDDGEASSGLAMRRPPRDWDKLKSPFMLDEPREPSMRTSEKKNDHPDRCE